MKLWKHQQSSLDWMRDNDKGLILIEPGLGKTLIALRYILDNNLSALVLCPKTLVESAWEADLNEFFPGFTDYEIAFASNREQAFLKQPQILITNFEAVNWLVRKKAPTSRIRPNMEYLAKYDVVVVDECVAFKNSTAKRSRAMRIVAKTFNKMYFMTGTPTSKSVTDMWNITRMVDNGERLGSTLSAFRYHYCYMEPVPGAPLGVVKYTDKPNASKMLSEALADIAIVYRRDDVMDLPENQETFMHHELNTAARKAYKEMKEHSITAYNNSMLIGINKAAARNKLLQICTGSVYDQDKNIHNLGSERADLIAELCDQREHTVVFFIYTHQRDAYIEALQAKDLSTIYIDGSVPGNRRADIVKDFQNGEYRVILLHPQTAAHGVTLTRATTTIFASPPADRAEFLKQGRARIWRGGQKHKTETIYLYARGTLEKAVYQAIRNEADVDDAFLESLKELS